MTFRSTFSIEIDLVEGGLVVLCSWSPLGACQHPDMYLSLFFWLSQISTTYNFAILWHKVMKFCSYANGVAILWITTFHALATLIRYFSRAPKSAIFGNFTHLYGSMCLCAGKVLCVVLFIGRTILICFDIDLCYCSCFFRLYLHGWVVVWLGLCLPAQWYISI